MTWAERINPIRPGQAVSYRPAYLFGRGLMRSDLPHLDSEVISVDGDRARVAWHHGKGESEVPVEHLARRTPRGIAE